MTRIAEKIQPTVPLSTSVYRPSEWPHRRVQARPPSAIPSKATTVRSANNQRGISSRSFIRTKPREPSAESSPCSGYAFRAGKRRGRSGWAENWPIGETSPALSWNQLRSKSSVLIATAVYRDNRENNVGEQTGLHIFENGLE